MRRAGVDVHPAFELDNAPAEALCYISIKGQPTPEVAVTRALVEMSRFVYAEPKHQVDIIDGAESLRTILEKRVFIGGDLRRFVVQVNDCMATPMAEDPSWQFSANGEVFLVNEPLRLVRVVGSTSSAVDMGMLYNFALAIRRSDNTKHLCLARPGENPCYISSRVVRIVTDPNREKNFDLPHQQLCDRSSADCRVSLLPEKRTAYAVLFLFFRMPYNPLSSFLSTSCKIRYYVLRYIL